MGWGVTRRAPGNDRRSEELPMSASPDFTITKHAAYPPSSPGADLPGLENDNIGHPLTDELSGGKGTGDTGADNNHRGLTRQVGRRLLRGHLPWQGYLPG